MDTIFTLDSAANENIAPWTDGLEQLRDNEGYSSVVGISGGKTPIGEVNVAPGAKKGLISLVVLPMLDARSKEIKRTW